ncbi:MAG: efflux RND transporter periplasmic adaptor subunit [Hyphomicrobium sp.]
MFKQLAAWLIVLLAIAGISGGLGLYKHREFQASEAAAANAPEPMEAVESVRARQGHWAASTRAIGTAVAVRQLEIRNEIAGTIAKIGFVSGGTVEAGQVLVQFDVRQEQAALAATEAEAQLAKQTLERRESLKTSSAFSPQEVDKARAEFAAATARARSLEVAIDKKRIVAPFKARIGITDLQPGSYLDAGALIGRLQGIHADAYVDFALPQDHASALQLGSSVEIRGAGIPNGAATAAIVAEDDSIDGTSRSVRFRAVAAGLGSALRPGTFLDVVVETSKPREAVLVPLTAVRRSPDGQHVFVIVDEGGKKRARVRPVETGAVQEGEIVVSKGLQAGEVIAASGSFKLRDGLAVATEVPASPAGSVSVN